MKLEEMDYVSEDSSKWFNLNNNNFEGKFRYKSGAVVPPSTTAFRRKLTCSFSIPCMTCDSNGPRSQLLLICHVRLEDIGSLDLPFLAEFRRTGHAIPEEPLIFTQAQPSLRIRFHYFDCEVVGVIINY